MKALPKLKISEEQVVELVRQLSPEAQHRLIRLLRGVPLAESAPKMSVSEFAQLPCFGMRADHDALQDSDAWVRKEREQ